jgi:hypothetical protein
MASIKRTHLFWTLVFAMLVSTITTAFILRPLVSGTKTRAVTLPSSMLAPEPQGSGYSYRRTITIDHSKVPNTDQSSFPLLISGTYSFLASVSNGGSVQDANGYDVVFSSDSSCSSKLNHEVETYNATTGAVNYWVKVPTLSHTTDTIIYMCYGNAGISTDQSNKAAVWDTGYKAVWHVPNGTSLQSSRFNHQSRSDK